MRFILLFILASWFTVANGASGTAKGTVEFLRTHDSMYYAGQNNWEPPVYWFSLTGFTQAGSCPLWNGRVLLVGNDVQSYAMVMSALKGGQTLAVYYDDAAIRKNGYCTAIHITFRSPTAPDIN